MIALNSSYYSDTMDLKYIKAIELLHNSISLKNDIRRLLHVSKDSTYSIYIANQIVQLDYLPACLIKNDTNCVLLQRSEEEKKDIYYYSLHNKFDPITTTMFENFNVNEGSKFLVYFSKPHNNFLIAEIVKRKSKSSTDFKLNTKFGEAIKLIFVYDTSNSITKVLKFPLIIN